MVAPGLGPSASYRKGRCERRRRRGGREALTRAWAEECDSLVFVNLWQLEALEACKWLRAAGFPQYAQMYEGEYTRRSLGRAGPTLKSPVSDITPFPAIPIPELQFPLDLVCVERDHTFLDSDSLQALFRRLRALNRCAKIRLDSARKNKVGGRGRKRSGGGGAGGVEGEGGGRGGRRWGWREEGRWREGGKGWGR
ncbi:putative rho GTPase-activating protein 7 [Penaeus vannamei]|uniref:Putative rho GTPase-activating protein 7 n=1 Tax=Penaeus vannamei TaxID=6689 RepID=A0A423T239_PENVA|nr:putative rho GTPase-activating protein 7 [Penaeus vannamei]